MVVLPAALVPFLEGGNSLLVGTCDPQRRPHVARAVGMKASADRTKLTLFLLRARRPRAQGPRGFTRIAIHDTSNRHPLLLSRSSNVLDLRNPRPRTSHQVESYPERFADVVAYAGLARHRDAAQHLARAGGRHRGQRPVRPVAWAQAGATRRADLRDELQGGPAMNSGASA